MLVFTKENVENATILKNTIQQKMKEVETSLKKTLLVFNIDEVTT